MKQGRQKGTDGKGRNRSRERASKCRRRKERKDEKIRYPIRRHEETVLLIQAGSAATTQMSSHAFQQ